MKRQRLFSISLIFKQILTVNAVAKSADYILKNENNEVENAVSAFGFAYDVMTFKFYKIQNVQDALELSGDVSTFYMHLDTIGSFEEGDYIEEGTFIGTIGGSGRGEINTHTPHLHYELKIGGQYVNPSIDKDNFIDPQLFLTPVHLGELEPAIISEENNTNLIKSFDVILSVMNNVQL